MCGDGRSRHCDGTSPVRLKPDKRLVRLKPSVGACVTSVGAGATSVGACATIVVSGFSRTLVTDTLRR
jgi:hypothetical protein